MGSAQNILFDPLIPWPVIWGLAGATVLLVALALWRGLRGWPLRAAGFAVLLLALCNPVLQDEDREALRDIVLLVIDESASQRIGNRPEQTAAAVADIEREVDALGMECAAPGSATVRKTAARC